MAPSAVAALDMLRNLALRVRSEPSEDSVAVCLLCSRSAGMPLELHELLDDAGGVQTGRQAVDGGHGRAPSSC
jgi:hypothetical protein